MLVTDLDGTLLDCHSDLSAANRRSLERLAHEGVLRVVATGRSLYSARSVLSGDFPIDYLVFSSGVGGVRWPDDALLFGHDMSGDDARRAVALLNELGKDFMIHHGAPDTHRFHYVRESASNADFERRRERYREFAETWPGDLPAGLRVSQLLAVERAGERSDFDAISERLDGLNVVRTTSPLDHRSTWIEIFPSHVSKSLASDWLRRRHDVPLERVVAVGNDHNDRDLLAWAGRAFVVGNAVDELKSRYEVVSKHDEDGFADVVTRLLGG